MNPSNISFSSHLAITHWNKVTGLSKFHPSGNIRRAFRIAVRGRRDARASKASDSLMGFGYEPHRCPGAAVALQEAAPVVRGFVPGGNLAEGMTPALPPMTLPAGRCGFPPGGQRGPPSDSRWVSKISSMLTDI
jgi:hypothetical protein